MAVNGHQINVFLQINSETKEEIWCAAHWYDGEFDTSDALPMEAQDDPIGYCERIWPKADVTESNTVDVY